MVKQLSLYKTFNVRPWNRFETGVMAKLSGGLLRWIGLTVSGALRWNR